MFRFFNSKCFYKSSRMLFTFHCATKHFRKQKNIFFSTKKFSLEVIKTGAKFVLSEQLWNARGQYRVFFFLIKSGQSKRRRTSTGVMLFIWESQRLYLQKKNKSPESGRWHFFHSARSISVPLFGGSAQINLALPPFPRAAPASRTFPCRALFCLRLALRIVFFFMAH